MITLLMTKKEFDELNVSLMLSSLFIKYVKAHNPDVYNTVNESFDTKKDEIENYIDRSMNVLSSL